jgi:hypothetical protein
LYFLIVNAQSAQVLLSGVCSTLTECHIVLFGTTLVAVTLNAKWRYIFTLKACSDFLKLATLTALDARLIEVKIDRITCALRDLDLACTAHALFVCRTFAYISVIATFWLRITTAVVAESTFATLAIVQTFWTTAAVSALLSTATGCRGITVPWDLLASTSITLLTRSF